MNEILGHLIKECLNWDISDVDIKYQEDGLTNQNYIITKDNIKYVIRIRGQHSDKLGINWKAELSAMKAASEIGIGAEVIYFSVDTGNMITKYIEGEKWTNEDIASNENMQRIADILKRVHNLPPISYEFSPYQDINDRIQTAINSSLELPEYLGELICKLDVIKQEREKLSKEYFGLCHNDPFPNNFIDDGTVRLIDWEYSGMGDVFFDLSCISMFYSQTQKEELLKCYFGKCDIDKLISLEQLSFVVSFWNAMWAVLQTDLSESNNDYKQMAKLLTSRNL